jgi:hypothetical protein
VKITRTFVILASLFAAVVTVPTLAGEQGVRQDEKALAVLQQMSAYTASLDSAIITGTSFTDARMGGGLMVANPAEIEVIIDRPGSLHISSFDGVATKEIYFHESKLTVFNSEKKLYAQAAIPTNIEEAMDYALEELDVEAPLMDLIYSDTARHLISSGETILYLTDKSRVCGVDCHHLAIRGQEVDVQLWVEEGDRPVPRKIMMTSKWEGGSSRYIANIDWKANAEIDPAVFRFKAPEGAMQIRFAAQNNQGGE